MHIIRVCIRTHTPDFDCEVDYLIYKVCVLSIDDAMVVLYLHKVYVLGIYDVMVVLYVYSSQNRRSY